MKAMLASAVMAMVGLVGCASQRIGDTDRLALYQAHAGASVGQIMYRTPMGWERIDDQHVVLQMRPRESWLLRLSGPCLNRSTGSPFLGLSSFSGITLSRFDKVFVPGEQISCLIQDIRPLDVKALRAAETALREQAQVSGT